MNRKINKYKISVFKNVFETEAEEVPEFSTFKELFDSVYDPEDLKQRMKKGSEDIEALYNKWTPAFSPFIFKDNARSSRNSIETSLFILDIDQYSTFEQVEEAIKAKGLEGGIVTSHSHTPEWNKMRVLISLESPIQSKDLKKHAKRILKLAGLDKIRGIDEGCLEDKARLYQTSTMENPEYWRKVYIEGNPLSIKMPRLQAMESEENRLSNSKQIEPKESFDSYFNNLLKKGEVKQDVVEEYLEELVEEFEVVLKGGRHTALMETLGHLFNLCYYELASRDRVVKRLMSCKTTMSPYDLQKKIQGAFDTFTVGPIKNVARFFEVKYWDEQKAYNDLKRLKEAFQKEEEHFKKLEAFKDYATYLWVISIANVLPQELSKANVIRSLHGQLEKAKLTSNKFQKVIDKLEKVSRAGKDKILNSLKNESEMYLYRDGLKTFDSFSKLPDPEAVKRFKYTSKGEHNIEFNLSKIFERDRRFWGLGLNDLKMQPELNGELLDDGFVDRVQCWLVETYGLTAAVDKVVKKLNARACSKVLNKATEYYNSILPEWDKKSRFDLLVKDILKVDSSLHDVSVQFMKRWFIALMARGYKGNSPEKTNDGHVIRPGKVDTVLVFVSGQGDSKSSFFEELVSDDYFCDSFFGFDRDNLQKAHESLISEIPEIDKLIFSKGASELKAEISKKKDKFVLKYDKYPVTFDRKFLLVGSTNQTECLRDRTGNRRFWPILVGNIDLNLLKENKLQLLAEARELFFSGERWWFTKEEQVKVEDYLEAFLPKYDWESMFLARLKSRENEYFELHELEELAKDTDNWGNVSKLDYQEKNRVKSLLEMNGWVLERLPRSVNSSRLRRWFVPDKVGTPSTGGEDQASTFDEFPEPIELEQFLDTIH